MLAILALLALIFPNFSRAAQGEPVIPALTSRVVDRAGILTAVHSAEIVKRLQDFEKARGAQVAVLTVPSTKPWSIEYYSIRVAEAWKIGREKPDDGAILVVAVQDRTLRIEVGRGLEGSLSDLVSKRIIEDIIVPHFKEGDMSGGVEAGVDAMLKVIEGEPLPTPEPGSDGGGGSGGGENIGGFALLALFAFGHFFRAILGRFLGGGLGGALAGAAAWFITGSLAMAAGIALIGFLIIVFGGLIGGGRGGFGGLGGGFRGGGGGFRGGGGSFGGGGASGRW